MRTITNTRKATGVLFNILFRSITLQTHLDNLIEKGGNLYDHILNFLKNSQGNDFFETRELEAIARVIADTKSCEPNFYLDFEGTANAVAFCHMHGYISGLNELSFHIGHIIHKIEDEELTFEEMVEIEKYIYSIISSRFYKNMRSSLVTVPD